MQTFKNLGLVQVECGSLTQNTYIYHVLRALTKKFYFFLIITFKNNSINECVNFVFVVISNNPNCSVNPTPGDIWPDLCWLWLAPESVLKVVKQVFNNEGAVLDTGSISAWISPIPSLISSDLTTNKQTSLRAGNQVRRAFSYFLVL